MRRLVFGAAIAALALVAGVLVVLWSLDAIVKGAIERYGSEATKVTVHVGSVSLSVAHGSAAISDLTVANPSGFSPANVFRLGKTQVVIDLGTIRSNPMRIDEITIIAPEVHFELNQRGESNVEVVRRNLKQFGSGTSTEVSVPSEPTPAHPAGKERANAQRFVIKKLSIQAARLIIDAGVLGGTSRALKLPDTEETDIGAYPGGATAGEVAAAVVRTLVRDVAANVAAEKVERELEKHIGGEAGKALSEGVGEAVKGVGRALNKIFGGPEK